MINLDKRTFRISGDYITDTTDNYTYKIENITKDGIVIITNSDNGTQINKIISWDSIKR